MQRAAQSLAAAGATGGGKGSRWPPPLSAGPAAASCATPAPRPWGWQPQGRLTCSAVCQGLQGAAGQQRQRQQRQLAAGRAASCRHGAAARPEGVQARGAEGGPRGERAARLPRGPRRLLLVQGCQEGLLEGEGGRGRVRELRAWGPRPPCLLLARKNGVLERELEPGLGDPMPAGAATRVLSRPTDWRLGSWGMRCPGSADRCLHMPRQRALPTTAGSVYSLLGFAGRRSGSGRPPQPRAPPALAGRAGICAGTRRPGGGCRGWEGSGARQGGAGGRGPAGAPGWGGGGPAAAVCGHTCAPAAACDTVPLRPSG